MSLRSIPPDMDRASVARIDALLDRAAAEHDVFLPLAVESGSRAWGFPSPDSDYDCRFIFVRPVSQHLTPWPPRDVIEYPPEGDMDANGWDLGKALRLLLGGNAVVIEWLRSPVLYRGEAWFRDGLLDLARQVVDRGAIARHYLHLGERQRRTHFGDGTSVARKKIFYALRPAAVLRWLRLRPADILPPMHFPTLMAECEPPASLRSDVSDLMRQKAVTRELGAAALPQSVARFIDEEFELARTVFGTRRTDLPEFAIGEAGRFYSATVERLERGTIECPARDVPATSDGRNGQAGH